MRKSISIYTQKQELNQSNPIKYSQLYSIPNLQIEEEKKYYKSSWRKKRISPEKKNIITIEQQKILHALR